MTDTLDRRSAVIFASAVAIQAVGFPFVSLIFALGDRFQAPSWVVIVLISIMAVVLDKGVSRDKAR